MKYTILRRTTRNNLSNLNEVHLSLNIDGLEFGGCYAYEDGCEAEVEEQLQPLLDSAKKCICEVQFVKTKGVTPKDYKEFKNILKPKKTDPRNFRGYNPEYLKYEKDNLSRIEVEIQDTDN